MNVRTALQPSYLLQNILQLSTFTLKEGDFVKRDPRVRLAITFTFSLILCLNLWANYCTLQTERTHYLFTDMVVVCLYHGGVIILASIVFQAQYRTDLEIVLWKDFFQLEEDLRKLTINIQPFTIKWCAVGWIGVNLIMVVILVWDVTMVYFTKTIWYLMAELLYTAGTVYRTWLTVIFNSWIYLIVTVLQKCNRTEITLRQLQEIHVNLHELIQKIMKLYSTSVLVHLYYNFIITVNNSFYVIRMLYGTREFDPTFMCGVVLRTADFLVFVAVCHKCSQGVKFMKRRLWRETRKKGDREARAFGLQLLHYDFNIEAARWFTLEVPVVSAAISFAAVCLLMLTQFDQKI